MLFQSMLDSFQVTRVTLSSADPTPRSLEDASSRKRNSKILLTGSEALSKFHFNDSIFYSFKTDQRSFDATRPNFFRGYGKTTMLAPHPALHEEWSTTFRKTYLKPNNRTKPNAHTKMPVAEVEFDNALKEGYRASTIASGF